MDRVAPQRELAPSPGVCPRRFHEFVSAHHANLISAAGCGTGGCGPEAKRGRCASASGQGRGKDRAVSVEERERLKKAKAEGKVQRAEEAAMKKATGPLRKIVQPTRWECSNTACCARWVTPELGLKSKWLGCDHCNRWWCPRSECLAQLKVHEPICRLLAIEEKKQADADLRRNWKP